MIRIGPVFRTGAVVTLALTCIGCVAALHENPVIADPTHSGRSAAGLFEEANSLWRDRYDAATAARARDLFVASASTDPGCSDCWLQALTATAYIVEH